MIILRQKEFHEFRTPSGDLMYFPQLPQDAELYCSPLKKIESPAKRIRYIQLQSKIKPDDFSNIVDKVDRELGITAYRDPEKGKIYYKPKTYLDRYERSDMEMIAKEAAERNSKLPLTGTARYTLEEAAPKYPRRYYGAFVYPNAEEELQRVMTTAKAKKANKFILNSPIPKKAVSQYVNFENPSIMSSTKRIAKKAIRMRI